MITKVKYFFGIKFLWKNCFKNFCCYLQVHHVFSAELVTLVCVLDGRRGVVSVCFGQYDTGCWLCMNGISTPVIRVESNCLFCDDK